VKYYKYFILTVAIIALDQASKMLVYYNMNLYEEINVIGQWFRIHFILNKGIAFGMSLDWPYSKLILTIFRLIASIGGIYFLYKYAKKGLHQGALWAGALILAGAIGNLIDSLFYGVWLDNAPYDAPFNLFNGQVIDMLYFPLFEFTWPSWVPFVGGQYFHFFNAIFNIADSSIFIGVAILLIFQKTFFPEQHNKKSKDALPVDEQSMANFSLEQTISGTEEDCCIPS